MSCLVRNNNLEVLTLIDKEMKKKKMNSEESKKESGENGINQEDLLDLDNLLDVQGGKEDDNKNVSCGLGCFTGATLRQQTESQNESKLE